MYLKQCVLILGLIAIVNCKPSDKAAEAIENGIALQKDIFQEKFANLNERQIDLKDISNNTRSPVFDDRYDELPKHCKREKLPTSCTEATECTKTSGYYYINVARYRNHTFLAFCDYNNFDGDWLYILRRVDGGEVFTRSWLDYSQGFGNVGGEHWIGLENLHALTSYSGQQELYIYIENFEGQTRYAHYDNFVVGSASEKYRLKSLGRYTGTAGDSFFFHLGAQFSTFDSDNDLSTSNCADLHKGGFWYTNCMNINPTGKYYRGRYSTLSTEGVVWNLFGGNFYSHKTMIFMIRRQRSIVYEN